MTNTTNVPAFDFSAKFENAEAAQNAAKVADLSNFRITKVTEGEWIIVDARSKPASKPAQPEAAAKPAKGKGKGAKAASKAAKPASAIEKRKQADLAKARAAGPKAKAEVQAGWRKLDARKWTGIWADLEKAAQGGKLPDAGKAGSAFDAIFPYGKDKDGNPSRPLFETKTHHAFKARILALADLIRKRDEKGLRALQIREISTTPIMLAKLRDLTLAALTAKAEKPAKKAKPAQPEAQAEAQPTS